MGLENVLLRQYKQTAVYWGVSGNDGQGGFTYDTPVELAPPSNGVRWEIMDQVVRDDKGVEFTSRALVFVAQDVEVEGLLYLGTLDSLYDLLDESSESVLDDPKSLAATYNLSIFTIRRFQKVPGLGSTTDFLRKAYLTPSRSFGGF